MGLFEIPGLEMILAEILGSAVVLATLMILAMPKLAEVR